MITQINSGFSIEFEYGDNNLIFWDKVSFFLNINKKSTDILKY